jgi:Tfp pilus assembly protein PilO
MKQFRKFFRTYQELLISVLILVGIGIGVLVGIIPVVNKIIELRNQSNDLQTLIEAMRVKVNILDSSDEETNKRYLSELALAVPQDKSLTSVFSTIDGLGTETGVTLSDFTLTKPGSIASGSAKKVTTEEKTVGSNFVPFTLTVAGTYEQIHDFFNRVVQVRRFFRVRHFDLTFLNNTVSARLGMDAYYAALPTKLGSAEQVIEPLSQEDEQIITKIMALPVLSQDASMPVSGQSGVVTSESSNREDPFSL